MRTRYRQTAVVDERFQSSIERQANVRRVPAPFQTNGPHGNGV